MKITFYEFSNSINFVARSSFIPKTKYSLNSDLIKLKIKNFLISLQYYPCLNLTPGLFLGDDYGDSL